MPRTALTPQTVVSTGLGASYSSADNTNGNSFPWAARRFLIVKNTTGAAVTLTIPIAATVDGKAVSSMTVSVPATTGERIIGPFIGAYMQTDGNVNLDWSATGPTIAVLDLPAIS